MKLELGRALGADPSLAGLRQAGDPRNPANRARAAR